MEYGFAAVELDAAHDMGVMSQHDVRARVDGGMGYRALVRSEASGGVHDALVQGDDHQGMTRARARNVRAERSQ